MGKPYYLLILLLHITGSEAYAYKTVSYLSLSIQSKNNARVCTLAAHSLKKGYQVTILNHQCKRAPYTPKNPQCFADAGSIIKKIAAATNSNHEVHLVCADNLVLTNLLALIIQAINSDLTADEKVLYNADQIPITNPKAARAWSTMLEKNQLSIAKIQKSKVPLYLHNTGKHAHNFCFSTE